MERSFDTYDDMKLYPHKNNIKICETMSKNRHDFYTLKTTKSIQIGKIKPNEDHLFKLSEIYDYTFPKSEEKFSSSFEMIPTKAKLE